MIEPLPSDVVVLGVLEVVASFGVSGAHWLAPEEETERRRLRIAKRHDEWLAGRVAAKRAVQRATGLPFSRLVVRRSTNPSSRGLPEVWLDGGQEKLGHLSISHSGGYAAACFSDAPVGLDLERSSGFEPGLVETAFSSVERARLAFVAPERQVEAITQAWCAKEAYAKWLGRGFAIPLQALDPSLDPRVHIEQGRLPEAPEIFWARARDSARVVE